MTTRSSQLHIALDAAANVSTLSAYLSFSAYGCITLSGIIKTSQHGGSFQVITVKGSVDPEGVTTHKLRSTAPEIAELLTFEPHGEDWSLSDYCQSNTDAPGLVPVTAKFSPNPRTMENSGSPILSSPTSKVIDDLVLKSDTLHEIFRLTRAMAVVSAASLEAQLMNSDKQQLDSTSNQLEQKCREQWAPKQELFIESLARKDRSRTQGNVVLEHHLQNSFLPSMRSGVNKEEHHVSCPTGAANSKEIQTENERLWIYSELRKIIFDQGRPPEKSPTETVAQMTEFLHPELIQDCSLR
ncbi:hypothetical protein U0070_015022 [Myodes glareolus]|uniref:Uncharacterized protein n=1 Tax=Myodes glareolus TaxID=447135 RepID=A0AAW0I4F2_MYOGA